MQLLLCKRPHKSNVALTMCGRMIQIELSESILKQLIKLLFHTFLLLFRSKSQHGCPYFDLNIKVLPYVI